jgi:hypothetical protein
MNENSLGWGLLCGFVFFFTFCALWVMTPA